MFRRSVLLAALAAAGPWRSARAAEPALRVVAPWDVGSLEPSRAGYVFSRLGVAETLVGAARDGRLVPQLAASWAVSDDGLAWRFVLRDARFHDGTPVTAASVADALRRARGQPGPLTRVPVEAIEAEGNAVVVRLFTPFMALPAFLAHYSAQVLAPSSMDASGAVRAVVGTGPYKVVELGLPLRLEVERFDGWTGGAAPAIGRVTYLAVPRAEARALMAESGQVELCFTLDPPSLDRLRRSARVAVTVVPIPRMELLKVNAGVPPFDDVRVRRAVSLAMDRQGIARAILGNPQAAATQMFPPTLGEWHQPGLSPLKRDVAEAARPAERSWVGGRRGGDARQGWRAAAGDVAYLLGPAGAAGGGRRATGPVARGGMDIQVAIVNSSEVPAGHKDGTLQMALMARNFALVPDPVGTVAEDYGPKGGDWGAMGWSDPKLDDALARLLRETNPDARPPLRNAIATVLHDALPTIPVAWYDHSVAVSKRLEGVVVTGSSCPTTSRRCVGRRRRPPPCAATGAIG